MAKTLSPFEEAFAKARADGKKIFDFQGSSFTTETKEDKANQNLASGRATQAKYPGQGRPASSYEPSAMKTPAPTEKPLVRFGSDEDWTSAASNALPIAKIPKIVSNLYRAFKSEKPDTSTSARKEPVFDKSEKPDTSTSGKKDPTFDSSKSTDTGPNGPSMWNKGEERIIPKRKSNDPSFNENLNSFFPESRIEPKLRHGGKVEKNGKINLMACGISTHKPSKKNPNW